MIKHTDILNFWFSEIEPSAWFKRDDAFDRMLIERFSDIHQQATRCELFGWRESPDGRLAEIIVLDQFSRNMFRDSGEAFAHDALALALAQAAVACGADQDIDVKRRAFLYMPYMHSESLVIHDEAVRLFSAPGLEYNLEFEHRHRAIIERFGRYPHRNAVLGRASTPEELDFIQQPGSGF